MSSRDYTRLFSREGLTRDYDSPKKSRSASKQSKRNRAKPHKRGEQWGAERAIQRTEVCSRAYSEFEMISCAQELDTLLHNVRVLPRTTASYSIQMLATIRKVPVFIKLSFHQPDNPTDPTDTSPLNTERQIYSSVIPAMLQYSPHFTRYIGTIEVANPDLTLPYSKYFRAPKKDARGPVARAARAIRRQIAALATPTIGADGTRYSPILSEPPSHAYMVVTEQAQPGITLHDFMSNPKTTWRTMREVLFQLAHTLLIMEQARFIHNDLHLNNVFVYKLPKKRRMYYAMGDNLYCLDTKYFVALFDWDRSVVEPNRLHVPSVDNPFLTESGMCQRIGLCDKFTPLLDWFKVTNDLYHQIPENASYREAYVMWIDGFVSDILFFGTVADPDLEEYGYTDNGYLCITNYDEYDVHGMLPAELQYTEEAVNAGTFSHEKICSAVPVFASDHNEHPYIRSLTYVLQEGFQEFRCSHLPRDLDLTYYAYVP